MGKATQDGLCASASNGNKEDVLRDLTKGATPNREATNGWAGETPLVNAAGSRFEQGVLNHDPLGCVEALLAAGADANLPQSKDGVTPLCAAVKGGHGDRVGVLLQRGAHPEKAIQRSGETPLSLALAGGHQQIVEALVKAGADLLPTLEREAKPSAQAALCAAQHGHAAAVAALGRAAAVDRGGLGLLALDLSGQRLTHLPAGVLSLS